MTSPNEKRRADEAILPADQPFRQARRRLDESPARAEHGGWRLRVETPRIAIGLLEWEHGKYRRAAFRPRRRTSAMGGLQGLDDKTRILIADDHPLVLGALRQALSSAIKGAEIFEAADLESLSAALDKNPEMDLVMLDL